MGIILSLLKGTLYLSLGVTAAAAFILYTTKPEDKSFKAYLQTKIKSNMTDEVLRSQGLLQNIAGNIFSKVVTSLPDIQIKDYIIFKYAMATLNGQSAKFIGVLHTWHEL